MNEGGNTQKVVTAGIKTLEKMPLKSFVLEWVSNKESVLLVFRLVYENRDRHLSPLYFDDECT